MSIYVFIVSYTLSYICIALVLLYDIMWIHVMGVQLARYIMTFPIIFLFVIIQNVLASINYGFSCWNGGN